MVFEDKVLEVLKKNGDLKREKEEYEEVVIFKIQKLSDATLPIKLALVEIKVIS